MSFDFGSCALAQARAGPSLVIPNMVVKIALNDPYEVDDIAGVVDLRPAHFVAPAAPQALIQTPSTNLTSVNVQVDGEPAEVPPVPTSHPPLATEPAANLYGSLSKAARTHPCGPDAELLHKVAIALAAGGARSAEDFKDLQPSELALVWPSLAAFDYGFLEHLSAMWRPLPTAGVGTSQMMPAKLNEADLFQSFPTETKRMAFYAGLWRHGQFTVSLEDAQEYGRLLPQAMEVERQRLATDGIPRLMTLEVVRTLVSRTPSCGEDEAHVKRARTVRMDPVVAELDRSMPVLRAARLAATPPPPAVFAQILRDLSKMPEDAMMRKAVHLFGSPPPSLPAARSDWLRAKLSCLGSVSTDFLSDDSIWRCLSSWRRSAAQYAAAVDLWGRVAQSVSCQPWPPSQETLSAFAFCFGNGASLSRYLPHIRMAIRLVEAPLGTLADTGALVRGSVKMTLPGLKRYKPRATALETRRLSQCVRVQFARQDVGDSWVVARHFCLRYGSEVVPMEGRGEHSEVRIDSSTNPITVSLVLHRRKLQTS